MVAALAFACKQASAPGQLPSPAKMSMHDVGVMAQVLAVTCGLSDGADLAWWQPWRSQAGQRPWLPWAIAVQVGPFCSASVHKGGKSCKTAGV